MGKPLPIADTVKTGDTTIDTNGLTIVGGPSITKTGINAAGTKVTNVKAGTEDTDAVNFSQLKATEKISIIRSIILIQK